MSFPRITSPRNAGFRAIALALALALCLAGFGCWLGAEALRPNLPWRYQQQYQQQQHTKTRSETKTKTKTLQIPAIAPASVRSQQQQRHGLGMCICVDCQWVTSCKAYHFVETKHQQPHMSETPTFLPREGSPTIQVNIRTEPRDKVWLWKDRAAKKNITTAAALSSSVPGESSGGTAIESVVTNTTTTIEYDVVACEDFVLDKGCWVRNMPDEIKKVNPDFVPT